MLATVFRPGNRTHRAASLAALALSAGLIAGCGGSSNSNGTVSPTSYAGQVCTSVVSWVRTLQSRAGSLQNQIPPNASPEETKRALENFLTETIAETETATNSLRSAGVPAITNGKQLSSALITAFEQANAKLKEVQNKLVGLPANDAAALRAEVKQIGNSVQALPLDLGTGLAGLSSPELQKAANESSACRQVGARGR
jgi:hypothetical protein